MIIQKFDTPRLSIEPLTVEDIPDFIAYRNHAQVYRYQSWYPVTAESVHKIISEQERVPFGNPGPWFQFGIHLLTNNKLIGDIGIHFLAAQPYQAEIGFSLCAEFQGKGYAFESVQAVLRICFLSLGLQQIRGICDARNLASARLLEKLGFTRKELRPQAVFLRDEWCDEIDYQLTSVEWIENNPLFSSSLLQ